MELKKDPFTPTESENDVMKFRYFVTSQTYKSLHGDSTSIPNVQGAKGKGFQTVIHFQDFLTEILIQCRCYLLFIRLKLQIFKEKLVLNSLSFNRQLINIIHRSIEYFR